MLRGRRVAGAAGLAGAVRAGVERQELGALAAQLRGDEDQVRVDGEVRDDTPREDQLGRVAVRPVLLLGLLDALPGERVLQLGRGDGDAVEEQGQVEAVTPVGLLGGVGEFADDGEAVGPVAVEYGVGGDQVGLEVGDAEADSAVLDAVAEDMEQPVVSDGPIEPLSETALRLVGVAAVDGE